VPIPAASPDGGHSGAFALALAAASLALHLFMAGRVDLSPQEAYYWQYGRHLDLSYFDHPPLAAWTIRLATALFGQTERAVRLPAAFYAALFALFFYLAGRRLFGARTAFWALCTVGVAPLFALGQTVITPDAPLLAGWAAAFYFTVRALEGNAAWLLAAGAAVGVATLGKYTGWLLAPQIFLALTLDRRGRPFLLSPWPYLALGVALALFSPVLLWNARHDFVSFAFQIGWRASTSSPFSPRRMSSFIALQAAAMTPLLALAAWAAAVRSVRRSPAYRLCALFALPLLLLCLGLSPFVWVKGNWAAAAYPTALLAAVALYREAPRPRWAVATLGTALALSLYAHLVLALPALPFPAREDVTAGWRTLAARVEAERARIGGPSFVVGCTYKPASELAFYLPGQPETYSQNALAEQGLAYDFWFDRRGLVGREGIVVLDDREWKNCLRREELCRPLVALDPLVVHRGGEVVTTFRLWRCRYAGP